MRVMRKLLVMDYSYASHGKTEGHISNVPVSL